jgi:hypothetical protein
MEESSTAVDRWKNEWARQQNGKVVGTESRKVRKGHRRANRKREASFTLMGATMQDILDREMKTSPKPEHQEGPVARAIEQQTAKLPSDIFLWAAVGSISASLVMMLMGDEKKANFVGHWAPTFLILGMYNKMVKLHGSDSSHSQSKIIAS